MKDLVELFGDTVPAILTVCMLVGIFIRILLAVL